MRLEICNHTLILLSSDTVQASLVESGQAPMYIGKPVADDPRYLSLVRDIRLHDAGKGRIVEPLAIARQ